MSLSTPSCPEDRLDSEPVLTHGGVEGQRLRMCVVVTVDITLINLTRGRFEYLTSRGFDVTVVCAPTPHRQEIESRGVRLVTAPLKRSISPLHDLLAIGKLFRLMRRGRFDLVEVSTPKGALVGSIAAKLAGVRCIVHLLRGLAYEGQGGLTGRLVKLSQWIPCRLAHRVIGNSKSLRDQAIQDGLCRKEKIDVLGEGSSNGVDLLRFMPPSESERLKTRKSLDLPADAIVAGFVGRMTGDKGLVELVEAFTVLHARRPNLYLLLVGDYEERDKPSKETIKVTRQHPNIRCVGWQKDTVPFYRAMDFLVLPTYREGFGNVLLEAAAMQLATLSTDIVGCRDAVVAGETGLVIPAKDAAALEAAIDRLAGNVDYRKSLGCNGRHHVEQFFDQKIIWSLQEQAFRQFVLQYHR